MSETTKPKPPAHGARLYALAVRDSFTDPVQYVAGESARTPSADFARKFSTAGDAATFATEHADKDRSYKIVDVTGRMAALDRLASTNKGA